MKVLLGLLAAITVCGRDVLQVSNTPAKGLTIRIRRTIEGDHLPASTTSRRRANAGRGPRRNRGSCS